MPITHHIRKKDGLVISRYEGNIDDKKYINAYISLYRNPSYKMGLDELVDLSVINSYHVTFDAHMTVATLVKKYYNNSKGFRTAIVGANDFTYGIGRMYQIICDPSPERVKVLRSVGEALQWLGVDSRVMTSELPVNIPMKPLTTRGLMRGMAFGVG